MNVDVKAIREKADVWPTVLRNCRNGMFFVARELEIDDKEGISGRCMRGSDVKLHLSEKVRCKVRKDYME